MPGLDGFQPVSLFLKGGVFMWPLLFCSVLGLAVILDRAFVFLAMGSAGRVEKRIREALVAARGGASTRALAAELSRFRHPVAAVARVYLENLGRAPGLRTELV
ncbi:MAG: hypothetical protein N2322_08315, partial [Terrimicrobiaceae bacterium]|nr:hypothetical protein [Terrimicrobiaceae bacterium]